MNEQMEEIELTQYLRPHGQTTRVRVSRPSAVAQQAREILAGGGEFTCEVLMTGVISLAFSKDDDDQDIELVENGPKVLEAVDSLIARVHRRMKS